MPRPLPAFHRLVSALLALLVLATSVGLTAERHRCRISGRSTVALSWPGLGQAGREESSRPKPGRPCGKRRGDNCCDVSHLHHKLNAQTAAAGPVKWLPAPPVVLPPALPPAPGWLDIAKRPLAASVVVGQAANTSPPGVPRAGRVLLTRHCLLVV